MRSRTAPAAPYASAFFLKRFFGGYTPGIRNASRFLNMAKKRNVLHINIIKINFPISSPSLPIMTLNHSVHLQLRHYGLIHVY